MSYGLLLIRVVFGLLTLTLGRHRSGPAQPAELRHAA